MQRARAAIEAATVPTWSTRPIGGDGTLVFSPAPGRLPSGRRIYAIGDVRGCRAALETTHAVIRADLAARPIEAPVVVHLGNLIGPGPDSAGVIALLTGSDAAVPTVILRGYHEQTMLEALDGDRAAATDFLHAEGDAMLRSWGLPTGTPRETWLAALPSAHVAFLRGLKLTHRAGTYLFVHAGVRPGVPLARQTREDLLTIRQPFLAAEQDFGAVVVHGHSASPMPVVTAVRIGLDTGSGIGGRLSCAVLEHDRIGFFSTET